MTAATGQVVFLATAGIIAVATIIAMVRYRTGGPEHSRRHVQVTIGWLGVALIMATAFICNAIWPWA